MPFVQRVVQPVNVAQATAASLGHASGRFHCTPGKCRNNNCINKQSPDGELPNGHGSPTSLTRVLVHQAASGATSEEQPVPPAPAPMKKLKQHVEFLSTSPTRHQSQSLPNSRHPSQQRPTLGRIASAPQSPTAGSSKVVSGHEFDSISNITLSNALRQLASLVLIASDIFDDLQRDLQAVGERAGRVQRKIAAVERRVCAYDPKTVTVLSWLHPCQLSKSKNGKTAKRQQLLFGLLHAQSKRRTNCSVSQPGYPAEAAFDQCVGPAIEVASILSPDAESWLPHLEPEFGVVRSKEWEATHCKL
ncbi:hypothetical protein M5D96_001486 [Drosophila gunungcola]|uniref:Wiskott-Aldrich syndrome protein family member n=1 Tax=Drosophila gunungcola TaxID=103775 RepID=A0A9Q0BV32_9MUSC|nr:hypothetical protein M5D96_001486 [Drosophila gunungcola]